MTIKEIKLMYPIGTKFIDARDNLSHTITKGVYGDDGYYKAQSGNLLCSCGGMNRFLFYEGKFAEIISLPINYHEIY